MRDAADLPWLLQADSPLGHAPVAGMQAASEMSALGFQLLGRDISDGERSQVVSPAGFGQRCPLRERAQRRPSVWGGCSQPGRFYLHARCVGFGKKVPPEITGFLNPRRASQHSCCPSRGAPRAQSLAQESRQPALHVRRKCDR